MKIQTKMKHKTWMIGLGIFLVGLGMLVGMVSSNFGYLIPGTFMNIGISFMGGSFIAFGIVKSFFDK